MALLALPLWAPLINDNLLPLLLSASRKVKNELKNLKNNDEFECITSIVVPIA